MNSLDPIKVQLNATLLVLLARFTNERGLMNYKKLPRGLYESVGARYGKPGYVDWPSVLHQAAAPLKKVVGYSVGYDIPAGDILPAWVPAAWAWRLADAEAAVRAAELTETNGLMPLNDFGTWAVWSDWELPVEFPVGERESTVRRCLRLFEDLEAEKRSPKGEWGALARVVARDGRARQTVSADIARGKQLAPVTSGPLGGLFWHSLKK